MRWEQHSGFNEAARFSAPYSAGGSHTPQFTAGYVDLPFLNADFSVYIQKHLSVLSGGNSFFAPKFPYEIGRIAVSGIMDNFLDCLILCCEVSLHLITSKCKQIFRKRLAKDFFYLLACMG